ncbi:MAG: hypothetical protein IKE74_10230 [Mogibacterium sp.]|nr:hypothetical protein [Mogibacterium sp.]
MKRIISLICIILLTLTLAGCSKGEDMKSPNTADEFKSEMEELGLSVVDQTSSANGDSSYQKIYVATDGDKYSFEYYFMTGINPAKNIYTYLTENLDATYTDDSSAVIVANSSEESGKYEVTASDYYCAVLHNQNTVLYVTSQIDNADEAKDLISKLGY